MFTPRLIYQYAVYSLFVLIPSAFYGLAIVPAVLAIICMLCMRSDKLNWTYVSKPHLFLPIAFYVLGFGTFFFSQNHREAIKLWSTELPFLLYPLALSTGLLNKKMIDTCCKLFFVSAVLSSGAIILVNAVELILTGDHYVRINDVVLHKLHSSGLTRILPNNHPTYYALTANIAFCFGLNYFIKTNNKDLLLSRVGVLTGLVVLAIMVILLDSLINYLVLFILIAFTIWRYKGRLSTMVKACVGFVALLTLGLVVVNPWGNDKIQSLKDKKLLVTDSQEDRNLFTMRLAKWKTYGLMIKEKPILGYRPGEMEQERQKLYTAQGYQDLSKHDYNAHNQYLEYWAQYGVLGFVLLVVMICYPLFSKTHAYYTPFAIAFSIVFITEGLLMRQQGLSMFMALYALLTNPAKE